MAAAAIGLAFFGYTLYTIDLADTLEDTGRLGLALPLILLPGTAWHLLRTWGWAAAFPQGSRPPFSRLFRVRLAADAVGFFTVRGLTGEPLKVLLLYDRVPPPVTAAAVALERLAFAVMGIVIAALVSLLALARLTMPAAWNAVFAALIAGATATLTVALLVARRRPGDYLGRLIAHVDRAFGRRLEATRVVRFALEVEDILLDLVRGDRRRLVTLTVLSVLCYLLMTLEVWLVLRVAGVPVGVTEALTIETFVRLASVASAAVPANLGTLEASHASVVAALGLGGGGTLALSRRVRSLLWAAAGLALYPQIQKRRH